MPTITSYTTKCDLTPPGNRKLGFYLCDPLAQRGHLASSLSLLVTAGVRR